MLAAPPHHPHSPPASETPSLKIFINDQPIDFTLETEKNAFEVITAIITWAEKQELLLATLKVDGTEYLCPPLAARLKDYPLHTIQSIDCEVVNLSTYCANILLAANEALLTLEKELTAQYITTHIEAISQKITWIRHAFRKSSKILNIEQTLAPLDKLLKELESTLYQMHRKEIPFANETLAHFVQPIATQVDDQFLTLQTHALTRDLRRYDLMKKQSPKQQSAWMTLASNLRQEIPALAKTIASWITRIATYFQQGKTAPALALLVDLTHALDVLLTLYHLPKHTSKAISKDLPDEKSIAQLKNVLHNIESALQAKDYVEISDLLEYELAPTLKHYASLAQA